MPKSIVLAMGIAVATTSCTATMTGPWSAWTWREPNTPDEWREFYPLAKEQLGRCRECKGARLNNGCTDPTHLGFRNKEMQPADTCEEAAAAWDKRLRRAFLNVSPDLDAETRNRIESGQIDPGIDAQTAISESHAMLEEEQARAAERARIEKERIEEAERARVAYEQSPAGKRDKASGTCIDAMAWTGELSAQLHGNAQALRNIQRARDRGVEQDPDGSAIERLCSGIESASKQIGRFVRDLDSCDVVAEAELLEQDEYELRANTMHLRARATMGLDLAAEAYRTFCRTGVLR